MTTIVEVLTRVIDFLDTAALNDAKEEKTEQTDPPVDLEYMKKLWTKYESITNSYVVKSVQYMRDLGHMDEGVLWCATEKVHGANFSMICNGVDVLGASRSKVLSEGESFYPNWQRVLEEEKGRVLLAFKKVKEKFPLVRCIVVYGEYFGGLYSHDDVKYQSHKVACVQRGIMYSPVHKFYGFDIMTDYHYELDRERLCKLGKEEEDDVDGRLCFRDTVSILEECKFLHARVIAKGSFEDMCKLDIETMQSKVHEWIGLPAPRDENGVVLDNVLEGIVIRKWEDTRNGHCVFKIKTSKFEEVQNVKKVVKVKEKKKVDVEKMRAQVLEIKGCDEEMVGFIEGCVNENRFAACESKYGKMDEKTKGRITAEMAKDVWKECNDSDVIGQKLKGVAKKKQSQLKNYASTLVKQFVEAISLQE